MADNEIIYYPLKFLRESVELQGDAFTAFLIELTQPNLTSGSYIQANYSYLLEGSGIINGTKELTLSKQERSASSENNFTNHYTKFLFRSDLLVILRDAIHLLDRHADIKEKFDKGYQSDKFTLADKKNIQKVLTALTILDISDNRQSAVLENVEKNAPTLKQILAIYSDLAVALNDNNPSVLDLVTSAEELEAEDQPGEPDKKTATPPLFPASATVPGTTPADTGEIGETADQPPAQPPTEPPQSEEPVYSILTDQNYRQAVVGLTEISISLFFAAEFENANPPLTFAGPDGATSYFYAFTDGQQNVLRGEARRIIQLLLAGVTPDDLRNPRIRNQLVLNAIRELQRSDRFTIALTKTIGSHIQELKDKNPDQAQLVLEIVAKSRLGDNINKFVQDRPDLNSTDQTALAQLDKDISQLQFTQTDYKKSFIQTLSTLKIIDAAPTTRQITLDHFTHRIDSFILAGRIKPDDYAFLTKGRIQLIFGINQIPDDVDFSYLQQLIFNFWVLRIVELEKKYPGIKYIEANLPIEEKKKLLGIDTTDKDFKETFLSSSEHGFFQVISYRAPGQIKTEIGGEKVAEALSTGINDQTALNDIQSNKAKTVLEHFKYGLYKQWFASLSNEEKQLVFAQHQPSSTDPAAPPDNWAYLPQIYNAATAVEMILGTSSPMALVDSDAIAAQHNLTIPPDYQLPPETLQQLQGVNTAKAIAKKGADAAASLVGKITREGLAKAVDAATGGVLGTTVSKILGDRFDKAIGYTVGGLVGAAGLVALKTLHAFTTWGGALFGGLGTLGGGLMGFFLGGPGGAAAGAIGGGVAGANYGATVMPNQWTNAGTFKAGGTAIQGGASNLGSAIGDTVQGGLNQLTPTSPFASTQAVPQLITSNFFTGIATQSILGTVTIIIGGIYLTMTVLQAAFVANFPYTEIIGTTSGRKISEYVIIEKKAFTGCPNNKCQIENFGENGIATDYTITIKAKPGYTITIRGVTDQIKVTHNKKKYEEELNKPIPEINDPDNNKTIEDFASIYEGYKLDPNEEVTLTYTKYYTEKYNHATINNTFTLQFDYDGNNKSGSSDAVSGEVIYLGDYPKGLGCWPTNGTITQLPFGSYSHDKPGLGRAADAYDIGASLGTDVYAPFAGQACGRLYDASGFGNWVELTATANGQEYYFAFAHLYKAKITSTSCKTVEAGELIGWVGNSGNSDGSHLHYEVKRNVSDRYDQATKPSILKTLVPNGETASVGDQVRANCN
jgi:murein DD-endopeptidase MepM/ murein hydrolase activator NlpD